MAQALADADEAAAGGGGGFCDVFCFEYEVFFAISLFKLILFDSLQCAIKHLDMWLIEINSLNVVIEFKTGIVAFSDCLVAERMIFFKRSSLITFLSE